ncbi:hypothetical protein [Cryobacterium sp. TMT3-29-2]|nr:hypothetical protein [Cryobacterium sp. TMT3-29-2]
MRDVVTCTCTCTGTCHPHRTGGRDLLETMSIGGGQGLAAIFERV